MIFCAAPHPAEGEHGGREQTLDGAEPESSKGEPGLAGAESRAPWPALFGTEGVPVSAQKTSKPSGKLRFLNSKAEECQGKVSGENRCL